MSIELYTPDLSNRHEITHAISLQTDEYYNSIGKLILVVSVSDYNIGIVKEGAVFYRTDTDTAMIVRNVSIDTSQNRITAHGYTTNSILNKRVFAQAAGIATIEADVYAGITANLRELPNVSLAEAKGLTETAASILYGDELLKGIMPVLEAVKLGNRMKWDAATKTHVFEIYKGVDRTDGIHAVVFSEERGTASNLKIGDDASVFKNVCYVDGEFNDAPVKVVVGTATGDDRYELYAEAKSVKQDDGETLAQYKARLQQFGAEQLAKHVRRTSFSVLVDTSEFGTTYSLGDVVQCVAQRFGMIFKARIEGVKRRMDANGETTELVLGEPTLDVIGELKLWQK